MRSDVLQWIEGVVTDGGLAVVVTHEIEPFANLASAAIGANFGGAELYETLPADVEERLRLLDRLGRGEAP